MTPPLTISEFAPGKINLYITGDLTGDNVEKLKNTIATAQEKIREHYLKTNQKVRILLDMSAFSGNYDVSALEAMTELASSDKEFVDKTAVFGGEKRGTLASEAISALAGRENIKVFDTHEAAVNWLNE